VLEVVLDIGLQFWNVLRDMSPYLLLGFFVAGLLSVLIRPETVERHLGKGGILPILKASIFGVPLPLCSCGVIPVSASLRRHGASRGATTSFLLSTPQTGVDSILVTLSLLGPVFAVFRPLTALVTGLFGGSLVSFLTSGEKAQEPVTTCQEACCTGKQKGGKISRVLHAGFVTLPRDIGKALIIGLLIAGAISAVVPGDYFAGILGSGLGAMLVMMLVGIPVYVCATASVPVAAALIATGVSPGAALVFLMTGPATNAATIVTIWKIMGRRTAVIYLGTVALTALAAGLLLDYLFTVSGTTAAPAMPWMLPGFVKTVSAVVLLAVLGAAFFFSSHKHSDSPPTGEAPETIALSVKGMKCSHCTESVKRALSESMGVESVEVDLKAGRATVGGKNMDVGQLRDTIRELGYSVDSER
jgi:uncharacterized membrane protein YraQ (UPF0718 family)/copper chaperone CopZ